MTIIRLKNINSNINLDNWHISKKIVTEKALNFAQYVARIFLLISSLLFSPPGWKKVPSLMIQVSSKFVNFWQSVQTHPTPPWFSSLTWSMVTSMKSKRTTFRFSFSLPVSPGHPWVKWADRPVFVEPVLQVDVWTAHLLI